MSLAPILQTLSWSDEIPGQPDVATPVDTNSGVLEGQCGVGDGLSRTTTGNTGRHRIAAAPSDHPQIYREDQLMSACSEAVARRFGDGGPSGAGAEESDLICRVLSRKTVRRYSDRMPAEALLDLLVACALSASAKSDFQQASILRVRDPEKRAAIGKLFPAMPWIGIAPVFFVFLGDARRLQRIGEMRGKPVENGTLEGLFNASIDAALAMQTMILSAESVGLGVCPISVLRNEIDGVAGILGLPNLVFPVAGLCLGYPQAEGHVSLRLPRGVTAHSDSYDDSGLAAAIDDYDRRRDALHAIPKEQQRANAEFGEAAFYGWSEDKARQAAKAEGAAFPPYLRAHGFSLD